jgi:hypothetical protein
MKLGFIIGTTLVASMSASVEAGVLGYAAFSYTASNGNVVIDVFTVVSNASDRLLNVYNVNLTTTAGWIHACNVRAGSWHGHPWLEARFRLQLHPQQHRRQFHDDRCGVGRPVRRSVLRFDWYRR